MNYDANAQTPLYQKVAASTEDHYNGYFLTFDSTSTPPRWLFFADWDRETVVIVNSVTGISQQPNRLPSKKNEQVFIPPASQMPTSIQLAPYVIVPENPILSSTGEFCHDSCQKSFTSPQDIQMCTTSCNSRCIGRGYIDDDNITCICFADYKGLIVNIFVAMIIQKVELAIQWIIRGYQKIHVTKMVNALVAKKINMWDNYVNLNATLR